MWNILYFIDIYNLKDLKNHGIDPLNVSYLGGAGSVSDIYHF